MTHVCMLVLSTYTQDARVHKEARTLAAEGYIVTVLALWKAGLPAQERQAGYEVRRLRLALMGWRGKLLAPAVKHLELALRMWQQAADSPADIYHAHDANALPAAWLAARWAGGRLVYDAHELETGRNFGASRLSSVYRLVWAWPERAFIRMADAVITVSDGIADELARTYRIRRPAVVLNCPERSLSRRSTRLRDELAIPRECRVVLYQGVVAPGRGLEPFLTAVQSLPGVAAVVLGNGPLLAGFRRRVESGEWQRVYLPGAVPLADLPEYTASADVGVSLIEGICRSYRLALPNKLFEYMQAGIPVIASDLPEMARVVREWDVGEVVEPGAPAAIAEAIRRLLDDQDRYRVASANARRAAETFHWEVEGRKLVDLYRTLLPDVGRPG